MVRSIEKPHVEQAGQPKKASGTLSLCVGEEIMVDGWV